MFPGLATRLSQSPATIASATTITVKSDIAVVSGTAAIATINAAFGAGVSTVVVLIPTGAFTGVTSGNIAITFTAVVGKALYMTYVKSTGKWYPSYQS